ncbi:MAG: urease accessory protein UreE [Roseobacter sp.]
MAQLLTQTTRQSGTWHDPVDRCTMTYDERFLRRRVVQTEKGDDLLVDLPKVTSLNHGDAFVLPNGEFIEVCAANEPLLAITSDDLTRVAWHIGNRHTPCQIDAHRLLIQRDHVLADMLSRIGAHLTEIVEPFTPEGGAYGHGRTHGHDHSHSHGPASDHTHTPAQKHEHTHEH